MTTTAPAPAATLPMRPAAITEMLARAFTDDPMMTYIFPDGRERTKRLPAMFGPLVRYCLTHGEVTTTRDVTGAACWLGPGNTDMTPLQMLRGGMLAMPVQLGIAAFGRMIKITGHMEAAHKQHAAGQPHWYLLLLGVAPERQGRGIASALMAPVLAKADATGLPCYLDTNSEHNVAFYTRRGFRVYHEGSVDGVGTWGMRREPMGT